VKTRAPFGKPIGSYQALQHPLAETQAHIEAARLLAYDAAERYDAGDTHNSRCGMAKFLGADVAVRACDIAIQAHGGYGFTEENDVMALWPLARLLKVAPINDQMILNSIAQRVLGLPKSY
jgi:acyl-CoA dehydrogenase